MAAPLTAKSSIADWLAHPVGGPILAAMVEEGGMTTAVLKPVRRFALQRLVAMSRGRLTQDTVDDLVARVRAAEQGIPDTAQAASSTEQQPAQRGTGTQAQGGGGRGVEPAAWVERVTPGRFDGKTVIVTGAGAGIGQATASRIAREGAGSSPSTSHLTG